MVLPQDLGCLDVRLCGRTVLPGDAMLPVEERLVEIVSGMLGVRVCPCNRMLPPASFPVGTSVSERSDFEGVCFRAFLADDARTGSSASVPVDSPVRGEAGVERRGAGCWSPRVPSLPRWSCASLLHASSRVLRPSWWKEPQESRRRGMEWCCLQWELERTRVALPAVSLGRQEVVQAR